jgi:DNA end-binding protein Ku
MRFHDEVRPATAVPAGGRRPAREQVETAAQLVEALSADWDPGRYRDCHRERLLDIVVRRRKGRTITAPRPAAGAAAAAAARTRATASTISAATSSTSEPGRQACRAARR